LIARFTFPSALRKPLNCSVEVVIDQYEEAMPELIRWPARYLPSRAPIFVSNDLEVAAGPEIVWSWLVRAALWPAWYPNSQKVQIENGVLTELALGVRFRWRTFGVTLDSRIEEFVPHERIAWSARGIGVDAYHAWLIRPTPSGCHVLTEESQYGILARLGQLLMPNRMHRYHQLWLEQLASQARSGQSPLSSTTDP
jgi:uncharacterized protein YndB with AHSA1/START domain